MICPKCGSNNPKDPLQCIRCGYIFPEYISKHNIDMNRKSVDKSEAKRVEAIKNFKQKSVVQTTNHVNRIPNTTSNQTVNKSNSNETPAPIMPTKIKKVIFMGRNGVNRFDDIKECFIVSLIYTFIVFGIYYLFINGI